MKVEVVKYNSDWKNQYSAEAEKIKKACGDKILTIEHAGSTSVEGLAAKPTIDIYIGTKTLSDAHSMISCMTGLGYEYVTKYENELPFRRYFVKRGGDEDSYHIHVTPAPHPFRRDNLLFRDYISVNSNARKDYESLKLKLSENDWEKRIDYSYAKDELCQRIKNESQEFFGKLFEQNESEANYIMDSYAGKEAMEKAKFTMLREGELTAIRTDIFPGFSLNRALGITRIDKEFLDSIDDFYKGRVGKFALQIPPNILSDEKLSLLKSRGYSYANSWVTFCRDSSHTESHGTDLEIKEIGKKYAPQFAHTLNEVLSFPHEF